MNAFEIAQALLLMGGMLLAGWLGDRWLARMAETAALRFKTEQLRDRVFRDALDTIHHLRNENDQLTAMVMAMQNEGDD